MKLTHRDLRTLGASLGHTGFQRTGICAGFNSSFMLAVLAEDEASFYQRLALLATYKDTPEKLGKDIKAAQNNASEKRCEKDRQLLDIIVFFDLIALYLKPANYKNCFPDQRYVTQNDLQKIFAISKPALLKHSNLEILLDKNYSFTKETLTSFFTHLAESIGKTQGPVSIYLSSFEHTTHLTFISQSSCWRYVDINDFSTYPDNDNYFRDMDTDTLVTSVFDSFRNDSCVIFNTTVASITREKKLEKNLQTLDLLFPIGMQQLALNTNKNINLLHLCCQRAALKDIKAILKFDIDGNQQATDDGVTPFFLACQVGNANIIEEFLNSKHHIDINLSIKNKRSPFHFACYLGHNDVVKLLLSTPSLLAKTLDIDGHTPLLFACTSRHTVENQTLFKRLLNHDNDLTQPNNNDETALDIAFSQNNQAAISELLQKAKLKNYKPRKIMSPETMEKAKNWALDHPEFKLIDYLYQQEISTKKRHCFFDTHEDTKTKKTRTSDKVFLI